MGIHSAIGNIFDLGRDDKLNRGNLAHAFVITEFFR